MNRKNHVNQIVCANRSSTGAASAGVGVIAGAVFLMCSSAFAVSVGVVDSGTDLKHPDLKNHAWVNPGETSEDGKDSDGNGYVDDVNGWNFAEGNNQIIDYSFLGTFSPDTKRFFEVQLRLIDGTATEEDKRWLEEKRNDQQFIQELSTFANFAHGTHVAGIASRTAEQAKVMAAKIIPTKVSPFGETGLLAALPFTFASGHQGSSPMDDMLMQGALGMIAGEQTKSLKVVGEYLAKTKMNVANCSFGTGGEQAKMIAQMIAQMLLQRELSEAETTKYANYFMGQVLEKGSTFVTSSPQTLFVMAAGNDGANNDETPVFPANLKFDYTITVAATRADRLASFSNFGKSKVDIAAPGVGIVSAIPGDETMPMSGTSQAAPFVANLAGKVMDINPALTPGQVKSLLMRTVDKKPMLIGKVVSEGIANEERAVRAAQLSLSQGLDESVLQALAEVSDLQPSAKRDGRGAVDSGNDGMPVPMPSLFLLK